jgi:MFS superfamily sulfate permease-like transporter
MASQSPSSSHQSTPPESVWKNFRRYFRQDLISGFLVFLIALPLCLGIALASGFPAIAGVFAAVGGSILAAMLSNSELTIKGPAAGLIVIVLGAMNDFGYSGGHDLAADAAAYHMTLAVCVVAGLLQIVFGLRRAGILGDFFPTAVVHGMLAAIGVIIVLKQLPIAVGQKASGEPLEIIRELPMTLVEANPQIACIGGVSLLILFGFGYWKTRTQSSLVKSFPAQLLVLIVAVPLGIWFDLSHDHTYTFAGHVYPIGEQFLVTVPSNLWDAIAFPDWQVFLNAEHRLNAVKWVLMIALIGSLESLLSAKAIDLIDPEKRKSDLNRDLLSVGLANSLVALIGGMPLISEIVRSKANIDNGGRTRMANLWHGVFLLAFVALVPGLIHRVPLAALAAMLVYTGFRLASPQEFYNVYKIGRDQLAIFLVTLISVLLTDLLIGIAIGVAAKLVIHLLNGLPLRSVLMPYLEVIDLGDRQVLICARESAVFSNFIPFRRQIEQIGLDGRNHVTLDLSETQLVDHSVMEQLHELQDTFERQGLTLQITGLESHQQLSEHPMAARRQVPLVARRLVLYIDPTHEPQVARLALSAAALDYTTIQCQHVARAEDATRDESSQSSRLRVELVIPRTAERDLLRGLAAELGATGESWFTLENVVRKRLGSADRIAKKKSPHSATASD